jgi:hypothetical protein
MVGGPTIAQAFEQGFSENGNFYFGTSFLTVGEVKKPFETKRYLQFSRQKFQEFTRNAVITAGGEAATAGLGAGLGPLIGALRRSGAGGRVGT